MVVERFECVPEKPSELVLKSYNAKVLEFLRKLSVSSDVKAIQVSEPSVNGYPHFINVIAENGVLAQDYLRLYSDALEGLPYDSDRDPFGMDIIREQDVFFTGRNPIVIWKGDMLEGVV